MKTDLIPGKSKFHHLLKLFFLVFIAATSYAQTASPDQTAITLFTQRQKQVNRAFNAYFNSNQTVLYGAGESVFLQKIDSLHKTFLLPLDSLKKSNPGIKASFFEEQYTDLNYTFNKFILDYVPVHKRITGQTVTLCKTAQNRLQKIDINNPGLLAYDAYRKYLNSVLQQSIDEELLKRRKAYQKSDNQRLDAGMLVVTQLFKNPAVQNRMMYELLAYHIDNYGVKNIGPELEIFRKKNTGSKLLAKIDSTYNEGLSDRKEHLTEVYKKVDGYTLDAHIFMPKDRL
eukprot:gene19987-23770_t